MAVSCVLPSLRNALLLFLWLSKHPPKKTLWSSGCVLLPPGIFLAPAGLGEDESCPKLCPHLQLKLGWVWSFPSALGPVSIPLLPCLLPIPWEMIGHRGGPGWHQSLLIPKTPLELVWEAGSFRIHTEITQESLTQESLRDYTGITQGSLRNYTGVTQRLHRNYTGVTQGLITKELHRNHSGTTQESHGDYTGITWGSFRSHSGITQERLWDYTGITQEVLWDYTGITRESLRDFKKIAQGSLESRRNHSSHSEITQGSLRDLRNLSRISQGSLRGHSGISQPLPMVCPTPFSPCPVQVGGDLPPGPPGSQLSPVSPQKPSAGPTTPTTPRPGDPSTACAPATTSTSSSPSSSASTSSPCPWSTTTSPRWDLPPWGKNWPKWGPSQWGFCFYIL